MDLAEIKEGVYRLEIKDPSKGEPTGLVLVLKSMSHPDVMRVKRAITDKRQKLAARNKTFNAEQIEDNTIDLLVATIDGWEWNADATYHGERPAFTSKVAREVLAVGWIQDQVNETLSDDSLFFQH